MRAFAGNKGAHLRHNGNDGVLPQESRLTGHVRTGQQPNQRIVVAQGAVVADKSAGMVAFYRLFDNRMAPVGYVKDQRIVQNRTAVVFSTAKSDRAAPTSSSASALAVREMSSEAIVTS